MILRNLTLAALSLLLVACGDSDSKTPVAEATSGDPVLAESYWSDTDLPGPLEVLAARKDAKDGQDVVLVGRVKDFVEGRAVFTLIDQALAPCDTEEGGNCKTPWDYCCIESTVQTENTVTVQFVDDAGKPLHIGAKGFHGLDHLDTVTVKGKTKRDEAGNVTLALSALHRR